VKHWLKEEWFEEIVVLAKKLVARYGFCKEDRRDDA